MRSLLWGCVLFVGCTQNAVLDDGSASDTGQPYDASSYELRYADVAAVDSGADSNSRDGEAMDSGASVDVSSADAGSVVDASSDSPTTVDVVPDRAAQDAAAIRDAGMSTLACQAGYGDCDVDPANGCEVNTKTNPDHCGGCGRYCELVPPYRVRTCYSGQCIFF